MYEFREHINDSLVSCVSSASFAQILSELCGLYCSFPLLYLSVSFEISVMSTLFLILFNNIAVQLLQKLSITAVGKREKLLRVIKNPVTQYLPVNSRKIGESKSKYVSKVFQSQGI